jgi:cell division protein FtsQ
MGGKMLKSKTKVDGKVKYGKLNIYICIFFLLLALIFIIIFKTNYFLINDIIVKNNYELTDEKVIGYSGIQVKENIFQLKLSRAEENLKKHPYIKEVTIRRKLPNKIIIEIEERKKLASILYMGIYFEIDEDGVVLETYSNPPDVYIIEGFEFESFIEGDKLKVKNTNDFKKALDICKFINRSSTDIRPSIFYNNGKFDLYFNNGIKVKLGKGDNLAKKIKILLNIIDDLKSKNINSGLIDLSHNGYPIFRPFGE